MGKRKKRLSVEKRQQEKEQRARRGEAGRRSGFDSSEPEPDKTVTFFDRSGKTPHAYCDQPTAEEEIRVIERSGPRHREADDI